MANNETTEKHPLPPYVSYKTFEGVFKKLKDAVLPNTIDPSVLRMYAGSVQRQIIAAFKYLNLINDAGKPTDQLIRLHKVYGTQDWTPAIMEVIHDAYRPVIGDLNLAGATPSELEQAFKNAGAEGAVRDKCLLFFVKAAKATGMQLSSHVLNRPRKRQERRGRPRNSEENLEASEALAGGAAVGAGGSGAVRFSFPVPGKSPATLFLPSDLSIEDWTLVDAVMRAYITKGKKS